MRHSFIIRPQTVATGMPSRVDLFNADGAPIAQGRRVGGAISAQWEWRWADMPAWVDDRLLLTLGTMAEQLQRVPGITEVSFTVEV